MKTIELIVRGVLKHKESILLVRQKGGTYTFLPGGHIEFGEPAKTALVREIKEELGFAVEVKKLLGVVENRWSAGNDLNHELNLIFTIDCGDLVSEHTPESKEMHLEFLWHQLDDLKAANLKPQSLCKLLPDWLRHDMTSGWSSTFEDE